MAGSESFASDHLWLRAFSDVTLTAALPAQGQPPGFRIAAYSRTADPIPDFAFHRLDHISAAAAPYERPSINRRGKHLYAGVLMDHYGHFLTESLGRAWAIKAYPDLPFVWQAHPKKKRLNNWQVEVLKIVGIDVDRLRLVNRATRLETIILPETGLWLGRYIHPGQIDALAAFAFRPPQRQRVWLSRTRLPAAVGRVLDEDAIEDRLANLGWNIIHPQTLTVAEQLNAMADAELISGFVGSAFHTLILGKDIRARVRLLDRTNIALPAVYELIAKMKGLDQSLLSAPIRPLNNPFLHSLTIGRLANPADRDRLIEALQAG
jgi:capsular polysaccharide biosynthesis protein